MKLSTSFDGDVVRFALDGDVDATATDALRSARIVFAEGLSRDTMVDLGQVTFMDSSGIGWLIALDVIGRQRGGSVRLCNVPDRVLTLLRLSGLGERFSIVSPLSS